MRRIERRIRRRLNLRNRRIQLRRRNLLRRRMDKAKLTSPQIPLRRPHRRPKRPAQHRPMRVKIAGSRLFIQHRTRLIVGELLKQDRRLMILRQHPRLQIPRKPRPQTRHRLRNPRLHPSRPLAIFHLQQRQPLPQPSPILLRNRKHPVTALRTPRSAHQMRPTPLHCRSQRSIYDLNEIETVQFVSGGLCVPLFPWLGCCRSARFQQFQPPIHI